MGINIGFATESVLGGYALSFQFSNSAGVYLETPVLSQADLLHLQDSATLSFLLCRRIIHTYDPGHKCRIL